VRRLGADLSVPLILAGALFVLLTVWVLGENSDAVGDLVQATGLAQGRGEVLEAADALTEEHATILEDVDRRHHRDRRQETASLVFPVVQPGEEGEAAWLAEREREAEDQIRLRRAAFSTLWKDSQRKRLGAALDAQEKRVLGAVTRGVEQTVTRAIWMQIILTLVLVGVAVWCWRRRIARPLARLGEAMDAVAAGGDGSAALAVAAPLAGATSSLQRMVGALTSARSQLSADVDRQTAALSAALEELRAAQARLVVQERMAALGSLSGGVAHEFNNLLGGIRGCADDALEDVRDERVIETLSVIRRAADRGRKIVDGLLRFSQAAARQPRELDLHGVVEEVCTLVNRTAESREVVLEVMVPAPLLISADPTEIHQVVHNLVLNATQASPPGGIVRIEGELQGERVFLKVLDRGPGIAPENAARVFEPFFTTREDQGGVGLGLAMSHGITRALGGELSFTDRDGGGTVFVLDLPVESPHDDLPS